MATRSKKIDLPCNIDAEQAVLGSAISNSEAMYNVMSSLQMEDFYDVKHQKIYAAIANLMNKKISVDLMTVAEELANAKELENIGGATYLQELCDAILSYANLQFYIDIVIDQSVLRKMLTTIREIDEDYKSKKLENVNDFILNSETRFKESIARRHISSFASMDEVAGTIETKLAAQKEMPYGENDVIGLNTGYEGINKLTQGFQKGDMIVVAARPSVGKTALALNFAWNVATICNVPVAIFSLEMTSESLVRRMISRVSCVSLKDVNRGVFHGGDRIKVAQAIKEIKKAKIFIDQTSGIKMLDIMAKTRKLIASQPDLGLVIIDYLGLVQLGGKSNKTPDSRNEEVRKISLAIKEMAKEFQIPVLVVSQLSRDVEKRDNKRPMISDLRDSGAIEQDADVIMLLYREDYYGDQKKTSAANKKPGQLTKSEQFELARARKEKELGESLPGSASYIEVNVAKNRNGQTGKVPLFFYKEYGRFDTPSQNWIEQMKAIVEESDE